jgi:hypothetical protein
LVLTDDQSHVRGRVLDLLGEILREHVIDLDDETQSNETLDDHGKLLRLTNGDLENDLGEDRGDHLHRADDDVDKPTTLATLRSLDILQIPKNLESLFNLTINNHVEQKGTDKSDSCGIIQGLLKLVRLELNQEEQRDKNLDTEHDEALLERKTLL